MAKNSKSRTKRLSNPFSTGGGGEHFQAHVQASFVVLMLTNGFAPCMPPWPIKSISLQAKYKGHDTDDLVVEIQNPQSEEKRKILIQVKHTIHISEKDTSFSEVINAAWSDFNKSNFAKGKDVIALITGPLSATDVNDVRTLLEWARNSDNAEEFILKVNLTNFSNNNKRSKFQTFKSKLRAANNFINVSDDDTFLFLRHFHLLGFDLDVKAGITLALLHSHMGFYLQEGIPQVWADIVEEVHSANKNAKTITAENISDSLRSAFKPRKAVTLPEEFAKKETQNEWRDDPNVSELVTANLVGQWVEGNAKDIEVLALITKENYDSWLKKIQSLLQHPAGPVSVRNGIWTINHRSDLLFKYGSIIIDRDLIEFGKIAVGVLSERDPKFDLGTDQRYAANLFGKNPLHSRSLRHGVAEGLALLGNRRNVLINCSQNELQKTVVLTIRDIFKDAKWDRWASLSRELPILAEAAPDEFLKAVESALEQSPSPFDELFLQEGNGIFGESYISGLCWALETLAWDENFLTRATLILGELDMRDPGGQWSNRPKNSLTAIFIPFYPQTLAPVVKRKAAIETLIKELPTVAWKLLLTLLPNMHQMSMGTHKPKWRNSLSITSIDPEEYAEQISNYCGLTLKMASGNLDRLSGLVEHLDDLPKKWFDKGLSLVSSKRILAKSGKDRYDLWKNLTALARKHRKFSEAKWALTDEVVSRIEQAADKISPDDPIEMSLPLFDGREYDHYEEKGNWEEQRKRFEERQLDAVKKIFKLEGLKGVLRLANSVESPILVGASFSKLDDKSSDHKILPKLLDAKDKHYQFANGFAWGRVANFDWVWADNLNKNSWSKLQIAKFLSFLPFVHQTWSRAKEWLGHQENEYWTMTPVNPYYERTEISEAIDKLLEYGRPRAAIQCLRRMLADNQPVEPTKTIAALLQALTSNEPVGSLDVYSITELIKSLQGNPIVETEKMEHLEWAYLPILDREDASPKFLTRKLAIDANFFCEIMTKIYRSKKASKTKPAKEPTERDQTFAANAWRLLNEWDVPPGFSLGTFSKQDFKQWVRQVKEVCTKAGYLEVAFTHLGQVLFYTPPDEKLWINRVVAEVLNGKDSEEIRRGYYMQAHNSRGAHMVDPTGQPELQFEAEYKEKASALEMAGYHRFAITLREIATSYKSQAERIRKDHNL